MSLNQLLTGPPRVGKTTAIDRTADRLDQRGFRLGGVSAPEIRAGGTRVGFRLVDRRTGEAAVMAHIDLDDGPDVGKYTVDVAAVDRIASLAFDAEVGALDAFVIDEIAPMEVHSEPFRSGVTRILDSSLPVIGAIHESGDGFFGTVKGRDDVAVVAVTRANRDELPDRLESATVAAASNGGYI